MAPPSLAEGIYDVFLSFRGPETRYGIISHIYRDLNRGGIYTFKDDEKLKKGEPVSPALIKAIEKSRIAVIIFTPDFASSSWCLKEVAKIMECKEKNNLIVLPVFFHVDPDVVRYQKPEYDKAFEKHEKRHGKDSEDVKKWREALRDAGNLYGTEFNVWVVAETPQETPEQTPIHLKSTDVKVKKIFRKGTPIKTGGQFETEAELVEDIVREIWTQLNPIPLKVTEFPVGLDSRVDQLIAKCNMKSREETLTIGLCSIGGMGKTTLAKALYNSIFKDFEGAAYVDGIKGTKQESDTMVRLQEKLLSQMLVTKKISFNSDSEGSSSIEKRLGRKRVLLILDGVDDLCQINSLAPEHWFGKGSKIIITTTDQSLLKKIRAVIYPVPPLEKAEACELFRNHASRNKKSRIQRKFGNYIDRVVLYTKCHPLALAVLGGAFAASEENEWEGILAKFARSSDPDVDEVLSVSYDGLTREEKQIFLHIACFFNGWSRRYVEGVLKSSYFSVHPGVHPGVSKLIQRSLIMDEDGTLTVHDLIELMGKNIVDSECQHAAKRSRLWRSIDVCKVLSRDLGTNAVEAIVLAPSKPETIEICFEAFPKLENLRFLIMINVQTDFRDPINLPRELRWFEWPECPASCLKLTRPDNLAVLAVRRGLFKEPREP